MLRFLGRLLIFLLGIALLAAPTVVRTQMLRYDQRSYVPPEDPGITFAATPVPTSTPRALAELPNQEIGELRPGPLVVDLAHFNSLNPTGVQPLADALARRGIGLRLWLSKVDVAAVQNFLDFPDQSAELATQLADASALAVISPVFLWSPQEIALVERFVADGGRLLLISDPDLFGDFAAKTNFIAEPFGVVFNDDYLYDTIVNDKNFVHFFQGDFGDQAAALQGAQIAFYGGRSIGGAVIKQAVSAPTTLSSLRSGATGFTTVAIGGVAAQETAGRVLALSDFDVLTEPYLLRHDNRLLLEFVAGFLAGERRINTVADFPNYLSKQVALAYGASDIVNAQLLLLGAQLQQRLTQSSRSLTLTNAQILSDTVPVSATVNLSTTTDLIYLADYQGAAQASTVLQTVGIQLSEEVVTPAVTPTVPPPSAQTAVSNSVSVSSSVAISTITATTSTVVITAVAPLTATAAATPELQLVLTTADGLKLLAAETVLIVRQRGPLADAERDLLAVVGADAAAINSGVTRLLTNDLKECITGEQLTLCPLPNSGASSAAVADRNEQKETSGQAGEKSEPPPAQGDDKVTVLLVDDNQAAAQDENSEADLLLKVLTDAGFAPDLWATADTGLPEQADLKRYDWVIWSNAAYATSEISEAALQLLSLYFAEGGRLTLSSRNPIFGTGGGTATVIRDLVITQEIPELAQGLPTSPITLPADLPPATPLTTGEGANQTTALIRRGEQSENADAPALIVYQDQQTKARLAISGISFTWLEPEVARQLLLNLTQWILQE